MTTNDVMAVLNPLYDNMKALHAKGVQVMFLSNEEAVTIEFYAWRKKLVAVSMIIFDHDRDEKIKFVAEAIKTIIEGEPFDAVLDIEAKYKKEFKF